MNEGTISKRWIVFVIAVAILTCAGMYAITLFFGPVP